MLFALGRDQAWLDINIKRAHAAAAESDMEHFHLVPNLSGFERICHLFHSLSYHVLILCEKIIRVKQ